MVTEEFMRLFGSFRPAYTYNSRIVSRRRSVGRFARNFVFWLFRVGESALYTTCLNKSVRQIRRRVCGQTKSNLTHSVHTYIYITCVCTTSTIGIVMAHKPVYIACMCCLVRIVSFLLFFFGYWLSVELDVKNGGGDYCSKSFKLTAE